MSDRLWSFASQRRLWELWKDRYPHHVKTDTTVRPDLWPGHHASVVMTQGVRTWGFRTAEDLTKFRTAHANHIIGE